LQVHRTKKAIVCNRHQRPQPTIGPASPMIPVSPLSPIGPASPEGP